MESILKDFCADENNRNYSDKLKVASILWKEVKIQRTKSLFQTASERT